MSAALVDLYCLAVVGVTEGLGWLPSRSIRSRFVDALAWTAYGLSRRKRRKIEESLRHAYGNKLDPRTTRQIVFGSHREFWVEMLHWVPAFARTISLDEVPITGLEYLREALANGKGVILWESNGFGRRVLAKRCLRRHGFALHGLTGESHMGVMSVGEERGTWLRRGFLRPLFERRAQSFATRILIIPLKASVARTRRYVGLLSRNAILCTAGEGRIAQKLYPIEFLGQTTMFAGGMVKLSRLTGAPILPMLWVPEGGPWGTVEILPPIDTAGWQGESAILEPVRQFADALEERVLRWPSVYRNWHMVGE